MRPKKFDPHKILPFRMDDELYLKLKKLSYLTDKSMAELVRQGLEKTLNDYKNILTRSDIAI